MHLELKMDGFHPTHHFETGFRRQLNRLLEAAPSDSLASTTLRKIRGGYEGVLHVISSEGRFVAEAISSNLNDLVTTLSGQIHSQIRQWHGYRFR